MSTVMRVSLMAGLLVSLATLGACGASPPDAGDHDGGADLVGRTYVGDDIRVDDKPYPLVKGSTLRLTFDDSRVSASAGCNSMSGSATWDGGVLVVEKQTLSMTEMGCEPDLMDQDLWLADLLTSEPRLAASDSLLTLTSGDTVVALVDEETAVPDRDLVGTRWELDSVTTAGTVSSVPSDARSTLELDDNGAVVAFLGCNWGRGSYSLRGDVLTIGPLATTKKACPPPASDVESEVLAFLEGSLVYSIDGDSLVLTARKVVGPGPTALVYRASRT